jgi:hypothetical protein
MSAPTTYKFSSVLVSCSLNSQVYHADHRCQCSTSEYSPRTDSYRRVIFSAGLSTLIDEARFTSPTQGKPSKADTTPIIPSDEVCLRALRSSEISRFFPSDSNTPWFEALFTTPLPPITHDDKLPKNEFNTLFKHVATQAKTQLKLKLSHSFSHLPKSIADNITSTILASAKKSTVSKVPKKVLKRATHLSPSEKSSAVQEPPKPTSPSKENKPSPPKKQRSPPSQETAKTSVKASTPTPAPKPAQPPSKTATPIESPTVSEIVKVLHEAASPQFYFAADKTPTFAELFPGTTMPRFTRISGNVKVEKHHFAPLLKSRISSAHKYLRARKIEAARLPAAFMKYQTRLICRSIEKTVTRKQDARKAKKQAAASKAVPKKKIEFTPGSFKTPAPSASQAPLPSADYDEVFALRDLRSQAQALVAEAALPVSLCDPRLHDAFMSNPALKSFMSVRFPDSQFGNCNRLTFDAACKLTEIKFEVHIYMAKLLLPVLVSRTSMSYEPSISQSK